MTSEELPGGWITTREAAQILGVTHNHVEHLCRQGKLTCRKVIREWLVLRSSVEEYAATERKPGPKPQEGRA